MADKLLLNIDEAADRLSMSRDSLERLIRAQEIPTVKPGGGTRKIATADLVAYVERLRNPQGAGNLANNDHGKVRQIDRGMRQSIRMREAFAAKRQNGAAV